MSIDYKKELEQASRSMIMIHDPSLLIRLMVRTIVRKVKIKHAGMILWDPAKNNYVLSISYGEKGEKIPAGFARFNEDHPLIKILCDKEYKYLFQDRNALVAEDINKLIWQNTIIDMGDGTRELLQNVSDQMPMLNTEACVPAYYQHSLLAILLLGSKENGDKLDQEELDFFSALASDVAMAIRNAQLFDELKHEAERNRNLFIQTTIALGAAIEAKDPYTHGHTERVTKHAIATARQMEANGSYVFHEHFYERLYIAGLLHDVGKIGVPEYILTKPGTLTDEEYEIMKTHTTKGAEILSSMPDLEDCVLGVKYHHERYDGLGYPEGLKGDDIPMIAAVIAVGDTYDAMTTDRSYRKGLPHDVAIEEIRNNIGKQFHPLPARAFLELCERGEI